MKTIEQVVSKESLPLWKKWIEALRSGAYEQGYEKLKWMEDEDGPMKYCCLGILCEIWNQEADNLGLEKLSVKEDSYIIFNGQKLTGCLFNNESDVLPRPVQKFMRLTDSGHFLKPTEVTSLTNANDSGVTFHEIADLIERNIENLIQPEEIKIG